MEKSKANKTNVPPYTKLYCGVSIKDNAPVFNFRKDFANDIITLEKGCSGEFDSDGLRYFYAYEYTDNAISDDKRAFRNYLKGSTDPRVVFSEDVEDFVDFAVLKLNRYIPLHTIDAIIEIKSTHSPTITDVMRNHLVSEAKMGADTFSLVKEMYRNVKFDANKAAYALRNSKNYKNEKEIQDEIDYTIKKFNDLKKTFELFQIKRFIPSEIRAGFSDYFKFGSEEEKELYLDLQGANVLIYDDFITSGSTVREVQRYLRSVNENNTLTVFILVKQY